MIDLSYHKPKQPAKHEPEEIVCAVICMILWIALTLAFVRAL